jgi:hypothetical protein
MTSILAVAISSAALALCPGSDSANVRVTGTPAGVGHTALLLAYQAPASSTQAPAAMPRLSGRWELNASQSDMPPDAQAEPGEDGGRGGPGGPGGRMGGAPTGGGMGGMGGGGGRGGEKAESATMRDEIRRVMQAKTRLVITQTDSTVSIAESDGTTLTVTPNNLKIATVQGNVKVERKSWWDNRTLVIESKFEGGPKITHRITKVAEGLQLIVALRIEAAGMPRGGSEYKRVYDQAFEESK